MGSRKLGLLQASDLFHGLDDEQMARSRVRIRDEQGLRETVASGEAGNKRF